MESFFSCPVCGGQLYTDGRVYSCKAGHCFDRAAAGYVHLLPANRMNSKDPGDNKQMAAARSRFLSQDVYLPLKQALADIFESFAPEESVSFLDAGCGEGYYTQGIYERLCSGGRSVRAAGIDISKHCLRWAAKRVKDMEFAVASVYSLPVKDESADLLLDCFAPLAEAEYRRVLKRGGYFAYVVPGREHLWELKQILYEKPYMNGEKLTPYEGFEYVQVLPVKYSAQIEDKQTVNDLFAMTPYFWKTPKEGSERLKQTERLSITAEFNIHLFRKL